MARTLPCSNVKKLKKRFACRFHRRDLVIDCLESHACEKRAPSLTSDLVIRVGSLRSGCSTLLFMGMGHERTLFDHHFSMRMLDLLLVLNDLKTLTFFRGQVDLYHFTVQTLFLVTEIGN